MPYRVSPNEWTPHNTKYGLFLSVLCKSYKQISHWLGLDDLFATSKLTKAKTFHTFLHETIRHRPNFELLGGPFIWTQPVFDFCGTI